MQGSMGKAVCDHVIRDSIKMYTHKGAQLRLRGQHYSFSFSFFFLFFIVLGFIATFVDLYPFIYNFIGCFKKIQKRREKKAWKKVYCMEWQWYWNTGLALHGPQQRLWPREWKEQRWSARGAGWREAGLGCMQLSQAILQHRAPCILALPLRSSFGGLLLLPTAKTFLSRSSPHF